MTIFFTFLAIICSVIMMYMIYFGFGKLIEEIFIIVSTKMFFFSELSNKIDGLYVILNKNDTKLCGERRSPLSKYRKVEAIMF